MATDAQRAYMAMQSSWRLFAGYPILGRMSQTRTDLRGQITADRAKSAIFCYQTGG
jgi:hypothetical protein